MRSPAADGPRPASWVGALNAVLGPVSPRASIETAQRTASRRTGLPARTDDQVFVDDMRVLADAIRAAPALSPIGRLGTQEELTRRLETRLRMRHLLDQDPSVAHRPVDRPIIITGLPRTGTTVLHRMLGVHPAVRAPALWELLGPASLGREDEKLIKAARRMSSMYHRSMPEMRTVHPLDPFGPEECVFLLPHSDQFDGVVPVPAYRAWYADRDVRPDYAYYRHQLQAMQTRDDPARWVLKSPYHLGRLDVVLDTFPDATIVMTHRDPAAALLSWCYFMEGSRRLYNTVVDPHEIGATWLGIWTTAVTRARAVRQAHPGRFVDVDYAALSEAPVPVAAGVAARLGLADSPSWQRLATAEARRDGHTARTGDRPQRPSLARYGLDASTVRRDLTLPPATTGNDAREADSAG
ncbi:sulfotransferase family protein [Catenuloplanes sp. NPDC051500]|uniref:sulfotransferase family protein n=1 Tax=Catenuloplanes sp. NPDC051500 TaxID=3363959 RepID=UPI0037992E06